MSLKHALETAREILAQASEEQLDETYSEAEEMKKRKGTKAGKQFVRQPKKIAKKTRSYRK